MNDEFLRILSLKEGPGRTAALAQWIQGFYHKEKRPVLVGSAAAELLTGGACLTRDLDFVGTPSRSSTIALEHAGFTRDGRYWFNEKKRMILKFPSTALRAGEEARERTFGDCSVTIVSGEDLIVDRLSAWVKWRSGMDGVIAFLLYRALDAELDIRKLESRASGENVYAALLSVRNLYVSSGGSVPQDKIVQEWAVRGPE